MKTSQYRRPYRRIVHAALKIAGIIVVSSAVGLRVQGEERYSAFASEVLPNFSLSNAAKAEASQVQRVHHFSMTIVGGRSTISSLAQYQRVEMELSAKGAAPSVVLRLQKNGRDQPVQEYERAVSEDYFSHFRQNLRDLEIAQLTDLSPYSEQITTGKQVSLSLVSTPAASATYRFQFKDGLYDYPNSFEVHAPDQLEDTRYQGVRDLAFVVLTESFGDVLSQ